MQNIEFNTKDHITLRGLFFTPKVTPAPAIILTHGFTALKEHGLQKFADYFMQLGFCVLVYDHRNFGESDGSVRFEVDPDLEVRDMRDAISFLQSHPFVIPEKIGLWGMSLSSGIVLALLREDARVCAAVLNVPFVRGHHAALKEQRPDIYDALQKKYDMDVKGRAAGKKPMMTAVVTEDPEKTAVMKELDAYTFFTSVAAWENTVTLRSLENAGNFDLMAHLESIAVPVLFIVAENDTICPTQLALEAYTKIHAPKKCIMINGDHFAIFGEAFPVCRDAAGDWFLKYLMII